MLLTGALSAKVHHMVCQNLALCATATNKAARGTQGWTWRRMLQAVQCSAVSMPSVLPPQLELQWHNLSSGSGGYRPSLRRGSNLFVTGCFQGCDN